MAVAAAVGLVTLAAAVVALLVQMLHTLPLVQQAGLVHKAALEVLVMVQELMDLLLVELDYSI
jgi:hypothetical protein